MIVNIIKSPNMEDELSEFSIDGCYRYHLNGKKDSKLGLFIRRNEEDYKIVNFLLKTEIEEVVDDALVLGEFSSFFLWFLASLLHINFFFPHSKIL